MADGFGAFGKMPSVGDFFRVNPPAGFVTPWDAWVQSAMLTAQARLGADWDRLYMSAPIWRFTLSAGLAGPRKVLGVLMSSVDRVGRRFPLTLVAGLDTPGPAVMDHARGEELFARLEDLALDTLEDGMTREVLTDRLAGLALPPANRAGTGFRAYNGSVVAIGAPGDGTAMGALSAALMNGQNTRPSFWSAVVADAPRMLVCDGLPQGDDMQALLDPAAPLWQEGPA